MLHKNPTCDLSSSEMRPVGFHISAKEIVPFFKISNVPLNTVLERQEDRKGKKNAWLNKGTSEMTGKNTKFLSRTGATLENKAVSFCSEKALF